jgi:DNA repair protein RadC
MKNKLINAIDSSIVSEVELIYRTNIKPSERIKIEDSKKVYSVLKTVYDYNTIEHKESFYAMYLNRANKLLAVILISEGGTSACLVDVKIILQAALRVNASAIILSHNHPSGQLIASSADIQITNRVKEAAKLLDMQVIEHIIVTPEEDKYYSFADNGQI